MTRFITWLRKLFSLSSPSPFVRCKCCGKKIERQQAYTDNNGSFCNEQEAWDYWESFQW